MHDERVVGRPALGGVDAPDGGTARGVGAEAVDGLGGEGDGGVAGPEEGGGLAEGRKGGLGLGVGGDLPGVEAVWGRGVAGVPALWDLEYPCLHGCDLWWWWWCCAGGRCCCV